ncbi:hypothetical protein GCM10010468_46440 [Actinocorallia longicatena]|uniref:Uncharacterized protein n=1 Tax=Actinocorallia longicatena TaxID=111803 RepID=A0ABP6QGL9_9ACTN
MAGATVALERGRALMLSEALKARDARLDRLASGPHHALATRYRATMARITALTGAAPDL